MRKTAEDLKVKYVYIGDYYSHRHADMVRQWGTLICQHAHMASLATKMKTNTEVQTTTHSEEV